MQLDLGGRYVDGLGDHHTMVAWHPTHKWIIVSDRGGLFEHDTGRSVTVDLDGGAWGGIPSNPQNLELAPR